MIVVVLLVGRGQRAGDRAVDGAVSLHGLRRLEAREYRARQWLYRRRMACSTAAS
ncbi:MAG: hypothetical protein U1F49_02335 [Rubrivivax sp.]